MFGAVQRDSWDNEVTVALDLLRREVNIVESECVVTN